MFNPIPSGLIEVGKPIIKTLWDYVQGNFDDHEDRIAGVEQGATKIEVCNGLVLFRLNSNSITGLATYRAPADMRLIEARVALFDKGAATGTLEVDFKKATTLDFTAAPSVFTTKPSIDVGTAANYDQSTNATFDVNQQDLDKDDRLRFDITSLPNVIVKFELFLLAELN